MDGSTNLRNGSVAEDGGAGGIGADPEEVAVVVKEEIVVWLLVSQDVPLYTINLGRIPKSSFMSSRRSQRSSPLLLLLLPRPRVAYT